MASVAALAAIAEAVFQYDDHTNLLVYEMRRQGGQPISAPGLAISMATLRPSGKAARSKTFTKGS